MSEFLPGLEITSWGGICGPAGLPAAMVEKCSLLTKTALESKAVLAAFEKQGATTIWMNPADTTAFRAREEKRLAPVIRKSGARVD
jgi:tripartite-type tricarboxylate transporter receptor subunit TctC